MSATDEGAQVGRHLEEFAELYALGTLEPHERAQVEAHVAACRICARALGDAEATVAALDDAFVTQIAPPERLGARLAVSASAILPPRPRRVARGALPARGFYATAAAFLLATGLGGGVLVEQAASVRQAASDSAVLGTIATSHFDHVTFAARTPAAPVSKVLYARDGSWFYIVVNGTTCDCRVVARSSAGERDSGRLTIRGTTATLFARDARRPSTIALIDPAGRVVSEATLVYASR